MILDHLQPAATAQLGELGEFGLRQRARIAVGLHPNSYTLAVNQGLAAVQIDALGVYVRTSDGQRRKLDAMRETRAATVPQVVNRIDDFAIAVEVFKPLADQAAGLVNDARARLSIREYTGRGHRGTSTVESWERAVELDLDDMRRLLPRLDDAAIDAEDTAAAALKAIEDERRRQGEQIALRPRHRSRRRINWNSTSELEIFRQLRSITPGQLGFAFGGSALLLAVAALWFILGRKR